MSRYGYDYSLTPGHPKGWRSLFRNVLVVGAIAAISAVSGGVVALDLLGSGSAAAHRQAPVTQTQPVSVRVARAVTPAPPAARAPTHAGAAVEKPQAPAATAIAAPAQPPAQPSTSPAPQVASTPDAAPAVSTATVEEPKTVRVPESELTFTTGYARRRAVQTAATTGAGTKTEVARGEEQNHIGRGAKVKPRTTVARQNADQRRLADAHQQTFAFGDPRSNRRPPQQQGGLFSSNPFGGFFRGTF
jgi:hypothetical protein